MKDYRDFIAGKRRRVQPMGFEPAGLTAALFDWQREIADWTVRRGRAAIFADCGLGKTLMQLSWAAAVWQYTGKPVILHCPVGVRHQTKTEAERFNIDATVAVVNESDSIIDGINLVNYEKLHRLDPSRFGGVVLDESSILKSFTGKIKQGLCDAYSGTPYRLACTATPAPNDFMELGNHAEFLGVMPSNEMLSRWFINDTMKAGGYRLKNHAQDDFWEWMASWSVCISKPSDIGYSDDGFELPPLTEHIHLIDPQIDAPAGMLFYVPQKVNATTMHSEKRITNDARCDKAAELANSDKEPWVVWCDTDYEADALAARITDAVDVRGSDKDTDKEAKLRAFADGTARVIITKPTVAGFGMNWQHCNRSAFVGISYSYEQKYQAVRRNWRFGQTRPVQVHVITTPAEQSMAEAQARKAEQHESMKHGMAAAMRDAMHKQLHGEIERETYNPTVPMELPEWMRSKTNLQTA